MKTRYRIVAKIKDGVVISPYRIQYRYWWLPVWLFWTEAVIEYVDNSGGFEPHEHSKYEVLEFKEKREAEAWIQEKTKVKQSKETWKVV